VGLRNAYAASAVPAAFRAAARRPGAGRLGHARKRAAAAAGDDGALDDAGPAFGLAAHRFVEGCGLAAAGDRRQHGLLPAGGDAHRARATPASARRLERRRRGHPGRAPPASPGAAAPRPGRRDRARPALRPRPRHRHARSASRLPAQAPRRRDGRRRRGAGPLDAPALRRDPRRRRRHAGRGRRARGAARPLRARAGLRLQGALERPRPAGGDAGRASRAT
jgi:hypothetical protein